MVGPSRLVLEKNLLDLVYLHPRGVRTAMALFFLQCHLRYTLVDMVDKVDKYKVDNSHCDTMIVLCCILSSDDLSK